jgi:hypothetical protein
MNNIKKLTIFLTIGLMIGAAGTSAQSRRPVLHRKATAKKTTAVPAEKVYSVDADTVLRVRMNSTLSSKTAVVGQTFRVTVTEPVYSSTGVVVIPTGSTVLGKVTAVKPAAKGGKVGTIDVNFTQVNLPNGRKRAINGSLAELDTGNAKSDNEGTAAGEKTRYRKVIFIGGGGVGGLLIGAAVGGGKGALIGGIIGGVGGYIAETQTKGAEAIVKSGTEFGVHLNQAISLPRFAEVTP